MQVTNGLQEILVGDIAADGGPGTALEQLGYTNEDSATFAQDEPTTNEFFVEELDEPILTNEREGGSTFTWTIANPDTDVFLAVFGGTISGSGTEASPKVWNAPARRVPLYKTVRIVPQEGLQSITIPRARLSARLNSTVGRNGLFGIEVVATVALPTKDGVAKMMVSEITEA